MTDNDEFECPECGNMTFKQESTATQNVHGWETDDGKLKVSGAKDTNITEPGETATCRHCGAEVEVET